MVIMDAEKQLFCHVSIICLIQKQKNGHRTAIGDIPFLEFKVLLSNGDKILLRRMNYRDKKYTISFPWSEKTLEYTWNPEEKKSKEENYLRYCKYLEEINLNMWYQPLYRLDQKVIDILYKPYIGQLYDIEREYPKGLVEKRGKKISFSLHEKLLHFYSYIKKYQDISPFRMTLIS